jgi:histidyl-tRNA synthetase
MFVNFGGESVIACMKLLQQLRAKGITAIIYPDEAKMKKQFSYADALNIPYVAIIGESELSKKEVKVKEMNTGKEMCYSFKDFLKFEP